MPPPSDWASDESSRLVRARARVVSLPFVPCPLSAIADVDLRRPSQLRHPQLRPRPAPALARLVADVPRAVSCRRGRPRAANACAFGLAEIFFSQIFFL